MDVRYETNYHQPVIVYHGHIISFRPKYSSSYPPLDSLRKDAPHQLQSYPITIKTTQSSIHPTAKYPTPHPQTYESSSLAKVGFNMNRIILCPLFLQIASAFLCKIKHLVNCWHLSISKFHSFHPSQFIINLLQASGSGRCNQHYDCLKLPSTAYCYCCC